MNYIVKINESISDVVLNSTGDLSNWDAILTANNFVDWCPTLTAGQSLTIPDSFVNTNPNNTRQLQTYPACNNSIPDVYDVINNYINPPLFPWILMTGFWDNTGIWVNTARWNVPQIRMTTEILGQ